MDMNDHGHLTRYIDHLPQHIDHLCFAPIFHLKKCNPHLQILSTHLWISKCVVQSSRNIFFLFSFFLVKTTFYTFTSFIVIHRRFFLAAVQTPPKNKCTADVHNYCSQIIKECSTHSLSMVQPIVCLWFNP